MLKRLSSQQSEPVYSTQSLREQEAAAARTLPPHTLMQSAGRAVARLVQARFPHARRIVVLAGAGNNGGDGLVAATHLHALGRDVQILACGAATLGDWAARLPPDAAWAWNAAQAAAVQSAAPTPPHALPEADLYLDALLGIGLTGPVRGPTAAVIEALNAQTRAPVLSVDLPSGLDADRGGYSNVCVRATVTLSLLGLKPGLCTGPGAPLCGELWGDDLDLPDTLQAATPAPTAIRIGADSVRPLLPNLPHAAHKGQRGDVQVIGGAAGMTGAALLAARAAARLGAGRVFVGLLDAHAPTVDLVAPELMLRTPAELLRSARKTGCVVFGPGEGIDPSARTALELALIQSAPLVLDADALNLLAQDADLRTALRQRTTLTVLTPHPLEAARLLGIPVEQVQADRLQAARDLARRHGAWVVLKGAGSVIASPQSALWINSTGNGLLATAGSGDVLAGTIAALLSATNRAQSLLAAVWLHGGAADRYAALRGDAGLSAAQLPQWIARCWAQTLSSS
ncbi:MAG: NAD(P)H-hydrate dehydratase [Burkholderiaceae bacterium]|nr:NAD(P)H-hydrate dehydratase [Burkholderiaceae bacterium]